MAKAINQTKANVKVSSVTTGDVAIVSERAAQRLVLLAREFMREMDGKHGAQAAFLRRVGMDQGTLSKLLKGERISVGLQTVEKARKAFNLKHEYFHGAREPGTYHDYVGGDLDAPYEAWFDFIGTELGKSMSAAERRTLASIVFEAGDPTVMTYIGFLVTLRGQITPAQRTKLMADSARLDRENREDDE